MHDGHRVIWEVKCCGQVPAHTVGVVCHVGLCLGCLKIEWKTVWQHIAIRAPFVFPILWPIVEVNVVPIDVNIFISVWPPMLVSKPKSMEQFMSNGRGILKRCHCLGKWDKRYCSEINSTPAHHSCCTKCRMCSPVPLV